MRFPLLIVSFFLCFAAAAQNAPLQQAAPPAPNSQVMMFVEKMPQFPGGEKALVDFLNANLNYPKAAKENGIEGKVVLRFIVHEDGSISDIEVLRDLGGGTAEEAVRVVKAMPKWESGSNNGVKVPVYHTQSFTFSLGKG
jgi:periplasmic protein TonB